MPSQTPLRKAAAAANEQAPGTTEAAVEAVEAVEAAKGLWGCGS